MTRFRTLLAPALALTLSHAATAAAPGERYTVRMEYRNESQGNEGGSGSSSGHQSITVRVIAERDGGQELEYDLPEGASERKRLSQWQLPARIFVAADGKMTLLNPAELEVRRDRFLAAGKLTREACGKWNFTWNAFKIECDPQSALRTVEAFRLKPAGLADGAAFALVGAKGSTALSCRAETGGGQTCSATLPIDAEAERRDAAEADVAIGQMTGKPVTLADATQARSAMQVHGTIETVLVLDAGGTVTKRTTITRVRINERDGTSETRTRTVVLTRSPD